MPIPSTSGPPQDIYSPRHACVQSAALHPKCRGYTLSQRKYKIRTFCVCSDICRSEQTQNISVPKSHSESAMSQLHAKYNVTISTKQNSLCKIAMSQLITRKFIIFKSFKVTCNFEENTFQRKSTVSCNCKDKTFLFLKTSPDTEQLPSSTKETTSDRRGYGIFFFCTRREGRQFIVIIAVVTTPIFNEQLIRPSFTEKNRK